LFVFVAVCLVLFSLVAAAFLANKDVYIKRTKYKPRSMISLVRSHDREGSTGSKEYEPFNGHIKTAEQRTIIEQYGDWYTGR